MDRGRALCRELKKASVHHIVWLPDSETHFMYEAVCTDPEIKVIQVCREGEAVAICAGLHLGGRRGAALIENQGMFECGNILKWAVAMKMPMLLLVGDLGFARDYTEPFLDAFGIKHYSVNSDEDVKKVVPACEEAWRTGKPVALLLTSADGYVPGT